MQARYWLGASLFANASALFFALCMLARLLAGVHDEISWLVLAWVWGGNAGLTRWCARAWACQHRSTSWLLSTAVQLCLLNEMIEDLIRQWPARLSERVTAKHRRERLTLARELAAAVVLHDQRQLLSLAWHVFLFPGAATPQLQQFAQTVFLRVEVRP